MVNRVRRLRGLGGNAESTGIAPVVICRGPSDCVQSIGVGTLNGLKADGPTFE